jgi:phospho-N-acetylmuramoyl-pentapeptide-transferase
MFCVSLLCSPVCGFILLFLCILSAWASELFASKGQRLFCHGIRAYVPDSHNSKKNTPSFGGLVFGSLIIISLFIVWIRNPIQNIPILAILYIYCWYFCLGLYDDICKYHKKFAISSSLPLDQTLRQAQGERSAGISITTKAVLQTVGIVIPLFIIMIYIHGIHSLYPYIYTFWYSFIIVGSSNATNLIDGLDGLLAGVAIPLFVLAGFIATLIGSPLAFCCFIIAAILCGFLWSNTAPAKIFMGDVGSLPIGAALGALFSLLHAEWYLALGGGLLVITTLSVATQIIYYKLTGKRFFKIAPLHHHFELCKIPETRIVTRYWIITCWLCFAALYIYALYA